MLTFNEWKNYDGTYFDEILTEAEDKNTHSTHIEDLIFTKKKKGVEKALGGLLYIKKKIGSSKAQTTDITVKIDGAPAIFSGTINGKFFVATKGLFAKTPKINFTNEDIDKNHSGELAEKLKLALKYLKDVIPEGKIFQGDFLFDYTTLKTQSIDGIDYYTWHPNTIKYAVEKDTPLGKKIGSSKFGIIFHTEYTSDGVDPTSIRLKGFGVKESDLKKSKDVWTTDAFHKNLGNIIAFTAEEIRKIDNITKDIQSKLSSINWNVLNDNTIPLIMTFTNTYIRNNIAQPNHKVKSEEFISYVNSKAKYDIDSKKSEKGKVTAENKWKPVLDIINTSNSKTFESLFYVHSLLYELKIMMFKKLDSIKSTKTFLEKADGTLEVTGQEGFVLTTTSASGTKLVDRYQFSLANFSPDFKKGWSH